MIITHGDLWDYHARGDHIVISTNIGHGPAPWFTNNMGAGIAAQAADRFPWLPDSYGKACAAFGADMTLWFYQADRLILLPVKPYRPECPELGWNQVADLGLVERGLKSLAETAGIFRKERYALSTVGAGPKGSGGGLGPVVVARKIEEHLGHLENVTLVHYASKHGQGDPSIRQVR